MEIVEQIATNLCVMSCRNIQSGTNEIKFSLEYR